MDGLLVKSLKFLWASQKAQIDIDGNFIQPKIEEPEEEDPFAVDRAQAAKMNFRGQSMTQKKAGSYS